jgi:hypothetical protein
MIGKSSFILIICSFVFTIPYTVKSGESQKWNEHPEWIWCDDFEDAKPLKEKYQDVSESGFSVTSSEAFEGTNSLCQHYLPSQVDAGWIIRQNNAGYPEHLFMRWYHKFENGFSGFPPKMARMRYRNQSDWSSPLEIHTWINTNKIVADVKATHSKQANSTGWLPIALSNFTFANTANIGRWVCFEMEVQLNTPGQQDGVYRIWADDSMIVERTNVDLRGSESYLINEVMLDCYWNGGSPKEQNRYYDNFVISTKRIGPVGASPVKQPSKVKQKAKVKQSTYFSIDKQFCPAVAQQTEYDVKRYLLSGAAFMNTVKK